jgi:hypothetical protein
VVTERAKRDQERVGTIVLALDDQLGLDDGMVGNLAKGADPEFCGGLGGGVDDPLVPLNVQGSGSFQTRQV